jgi:ATP-dependent helicase/nuclease subunit B
MAAIARLPLEVQVSGPHGATHWDALARQVSEWAATHGVCLRDVPMLLPSAQLLPLARQAFGRSGGWQPRIETTQTLAASLGPLTPPQAMQLAFDVGSDRLNAARLIRSQGAAMTWARSDPRRFDRAVAALVQTANDIAQAAFAVDPADREAHWASARALLLPSSGPGSQQRWLARVALEWAAQVSPPATDRLFDLRPAAWIALQAGGLDPLVQSLMHGAAPGVPCLVIDADAALSSAAAVVAPPNFARCDGFEHEAQCAAAQVLLHLERGEVPVALIGQDRQLVRRVRALLERQRVPLADETGWALSTTRAAARVMCLLRAAPARAGTDALFDWLKTLPGWPGDDAAAQRMQQLERLCRRRGVSRIDALDRIELDPDLASYWATVRAVLERLRYSRLGVAAWLDRLREALQGCGAWSGLEEDEAGRAVLAALRLHVAPDAGGAWQEAADASPLSLEGFVAWVDEVLERSSFMPVAPASAAQVFVTPLARAMLRPFGAVVCPGADDRHLGASAAPHPLLSETEQQALGLGGRAERLQRETLAFQHAAAMNRVTFLRRHVDANGEPLADSPLLQRLALDLAAQGRALAGWTDPRRHFDLTAAPVARPLPVAGDALPGRVSASAVQALRDCPYRFFSRHVLGLREDDELEAEIEKRDYGTWLHAVLHRFHLTREAPGTAQAERERLHALAQAVQAEMGLADDEFLPFAAAFDGVAARYVAWLHERDAAGARWQVGERDCRIRPEALHGVELQGVIDRIDHVEHGAAVQLIDYKTVKADKLKRQVREPLEDTQLAFYAALLSAEVAGPLQACYLALDDDEGVVEVPHAQVRHSAEVLVRELGSEFSRLRSGAPLPALGEEPTCELCEARGLCRRDHWPDGQGA